MARKSVINVKINTKDGVKSVGDVNTEVNKTIKSIGSLQDEINDLNRDIQDVEIGSKMFEEMTERSRRLTNELKEVNSELKGMSSEDIARGFATTVAGFASIATGALAMADSLGLVDRENDEMVKSLVSGIAVARSFSEGMSGVIQMQNLLKNSTIASTIATKAGTVATRIFNTVVKANPIMLLVGALTAAVGAFALFNSSTKEATDNTERLNTENEKLIKTLEKQNDTIKSNQKLWSDGRALRESRAMLLVESKILRLNQELVRLRRENPVDSEKVLKKQEEINAAELDYARRKKSWDLEQFDRNAEQHNEEMNRIGDRLSAAKRYARTLTVLDGERYDKAKKDVEDLTLLRDTFINEEMLFAEQRIVLEQKLNNEIQRVKYSNENKLSDLKIDEVKDFTDAQFKQWQLANAQVQASIAEHNKQIAMMEAERLFSGEELAFALVEINNEYLSQQLHDLDDVNEKKLAYDRQLKDDRIANENLTLQEIAILNYEHEVLIYELAKEREIKRLELIKAAEHDYEAIDARRLERLKEERAAYVETYQLYADIGRATSAVIQEAFNGSFESIQQTFDQLNMLLFDEDNGFFAKLAEGSITTIDAILIGLEVAVNAVDSILEASRARQQAHREEMYQADSEALNAQLANRTINEEEYANRMKELNDRKAAEEKQAKRKAFYESKALAITNAIIGTAQAVIAAFGSAAAIPIAGVALGPIMAGVAAAMGAAQIGVISAQKFKAARGGVVPGAPSKLDTVDATLASGEMVINSQSAQMFPNLLSELNMAGGGVPLAPQLPSRDVNSGNSIYQDRNAQPLRAYVVESEITTTQNRVGRIERNAEF